VSRVPVVSKFDDGTVARHYRNWALEKHEFSNVAPEMMCEGGVHKEAQSRADPALVRSFVRSPTHAASSPPRTVPSLLCDGVMDTCSAVTFPSPPRSLRMFTTPL